MENNSTKPILDKIRQSTLDGMDGKILPQRMCGNTTRLVDNAIQLLYDNKIVVVRDHHMMGESEQANRYLFEAILKRIRSEYNFLRPSEIRIDRAKLELELL